MPGRSPCRLFIHLAFTYSVGPSSVMWSSELGPAPPFPTNESAWSGMVTGSQSRVWSGYQDVRLGKKQLNPEVHSTLCEIEGPFWILENIFFGKGLFAPRLLSEKGDKISLWGDVGMCGVVIRDVSWTRDWGPKGEVVRFGFHQHFPSWFKRVGFDEQTSHYYALKRYGCSFFGLLFLFSYIA